MPDAKKRTPVRMCISCGKRLSKYELLRLVIDQDGYVRVDKKYRMEGRGAYVCPDKSCIERLKTGKPFYRAFKTNIPLKDYSKLMLEIMQSLKDAHTRAET